MESIELKLEDEQIVAYIDNQEAGYLSYSVVNTDEVAQIEDVNVWEKYRGQGLYRMMLTSFFTFSKCNILLSNERNNVSNPIYKKWLNKSDLSGSTEVEITKKDNFLVFKIWNTEGDVLHKSVR